MLGSYFDSIGAIGFASKQIIILEWELVSILLLIITFTMLTV